MSVHRVILEGAAVIRERASNFIAKVGMVLGSGLGELADQVEDAISIPYKDIPGCPVSTVPGHAGELVLGTLSGVPVACLKGRVHLYEGYSAEGIKILIRMLKHLGCHTVVLTNAAGSLRPEVTEGEMCFITDHINFQSSNPMVGANEEEYGERFFPMTNAYDSALREALKQVAEREKIQYHEGVYIGVLGPCFETPAEINAFRILGADLVGMSTVPEVIVARHNRLRVMAISAVTNLAAGMKKEHLSHEHTLHHGEIAAEKIKKLLRAFFKQHSKELINNTL